MFGKSTTGRSQSQIAFPLASRMCAAKPLHADEHAQDSVDETAADSGKAVRAAPRAEAGVRGRAINMGSHTGADDRFRRVRRFMNPDADLLENACH